MGGSRSIFKKLIDANLRNGNVTSAIAAKGRSAPEDCVERSMRLNSARHYLLAEILAHYFAFVWLECRMAYRAVSRSVCCCHWTVYSYYCYYNNYYCCYDNLVEVDQNVSPL